VTPRRRTATTDPWGIVNGYANARGKWRATAPEVRATLRRAMGVDPAAEAPPPAGAVRVLRAGRRAAVPGRGVLVLEDGTELAIERRLPPDLPPGYHELRLAGADRPVRLIVTPGRCHPPGASLAWGWAVQVYATRSAASWGMGDLADLARLGRWSATELGAAFLLVSPMHAATPVLPQEASPYFPSSRRFRNPLYLRIEEVPGAAAAGVELERVAAAGRALNQERRIDRDAVFRLKMDALGGLWARFGSDPAFERYCAEQGEALREFATFCALAEYHGTGWRRWPAEHRRPDAPGVARFTAAHAGRVRFHQWIQWLLDGQLARAAAQIRLLRDLPIGADPDGADAWSWQELLATAVTVGAPPDEFNTQGQDWGLPPFVPHRLRAAGYRPFAELVRATLRHAGGLRVDHVLGLFRLYWIPAGASPSAGAYVRYPAQELLAVLALESQRAGGFVVGEDLGTVEGGVREALAAHGVLSCRVLWLETAPPSRYPRQALASVSTHDLPTVAGLWSGSDLREQRRLGLAPNEPGTRAIRSRLATRAGLRPASPIDEVVLGTHRLLARAPCRLVSAALEDALAIEERPNLPQTTNARRPNWSVALPVPLEALETHALPRAIAEVLRRRRPARKARPARAGPGPRARPRPAKAGRRRAAAGAGRA
jgi:4-alpha-glucanotransferase